MEGTSEQWTEATLARARERGVNIDIEEIRRAAQEQGIDDPQIEIDTFWQSINYLRIVLLDAYHLAMEHKIVGCTCCYHPDYVLHFTTELAGQTVYLRHQGWETSPVHHATARYRRRNDDTPYVDAPDIGKSIARLPALMHFYRLKGVPEDVLTGARQQIYSLIEFDATPSEEEY